MSNTETYLIIGGVVLLLLFAQPGAAGGTGGGSTPMMRGTRFRAPDNMPRYDVQGFPGHYGAGIAGDGPNGGVAMWQEPGGLGQTVSTEPALNGPAIGPDGNPIEPSGYGSTDFGARPPNWPYFEHWPTPLMKIQQLRAARAGINAILHPPKTLGSLADGMAAGGSNRMEGNGLGTFIVHS